MKLPEEKSRLLASILTLLNFVLGFISLLLFYKKLELGFYSILAFFLPTLYTLCGLVLHPIIEAMLSYVLGDEVYSTEEEYLKNADRTYGIFARSYSDSEMISRYWDRAFTIKLLLVLFWPILLTVGILGIPIRAAMSFSN